MQHQYIRVFAIEELHGFKETVGEMKSLYLVQGFCARMRERFCENSEKIAALPRLARWLDQKDLHRLFGCCFHSIPREFGNPYLISKDIGEVPKSLRFFIRFT